jgi:hypothetical protein
MPKNITSGILKNILGFRTEEQKKLKAIKEENKREAREEKKYTSGNMGASLLTRGGKRRGRGTRRKGTKRKGTKTRRKGTKTRRKH